ncbi:MAG: pyruvoyl-dependent arginine decarboxylase [Candidatus Aenigmarchaeota archaeon]|nr:pyruvoyl-dependent arginine decarboxylase [Candidatus Aenigmarchaeota archaeon]
MEKIKIGNRKPKKYFITSGHGESDIQIHAGSFDLALRNAGIENYNFLFYSSIIPPDAVEIDKKGVEHGAVVETIAAVSNTQNNKRVTSGLVIGWVNNIETQKRVLGLVAEYGGHGSYGEAKDILNSSLDEMFESRFDKDKYEIAKREMYMESFVPKKRYATSLVAICFVEYEVPILESLK